MSALKSNVKLRPTLAYAEGSRRQRTWRAVVAPLVITFVVGVMAALAHRLTAISYRATGYVQVCATPGFSCGPARPEDVFEQGEIRRAQGDLAAHAASPGFRQCIADQLIQQGFSETEAKRAGSTVKVTAIEESRLLQVTAQGGGPESARLLAGLAVREICRLGRNGSVEVIRRPELPDRGERSMLPTILAGVITTLVAAGLYRQYQS